MPKTTTKAAPKKLAANEYLDDKGVVRRRSNSQFGVREAMLTRALRPFKIKRSFDAKTGTEAFTIIDNATGKAAKGLKPFPSNSSARRALYKAEAAAKFRVTPAQLKKLETANAKAKAKPVVKKATVKKPVAVKATPAPKAKAKAASKPAVKTTPAA